MENNILIMSLSNNLENNIKLHMDIFEEALIK